MLLGIPDKDKLRLSAFISFYLTQWLKEHPEEDQESLIVGICSQQQFQKILQGSILKDSSIYECLLKRLGFEYNDQDKLLSHYLANSKELLSDLEYDQMESFNQKLQAFIKELEPMKGYALESITYKALLQLKKGRFSQASFLMLSQYYPILDGELQEVVAYFLLSYLHENMVDEIGEEDLKKLGLRDCQSIRCRHRILNFLIRWENYYEATNYCEDLLKRCKQKHNVRVEFMTEISRLYIVMKIQPSLFEVYAKNALNNPILQEEREDKNVYEFYHVVGLYYFIEKNFQQAWFYFCRSVLSEDYFFPDIIFLNALATILNKELPEALQEQRTLDKKNWRYKSIYTYYCLKNKGETLENLQDYLWTYCKDSISLFSPQWVLKEIIKTELEWIASQTGNRKLLERFLSL